MSRPGLILGAALFSFCGGVPASAQTLSEALTAAYETNPTLAQQRATVRRTDEGVAQALSNWRPTVEGTVDGGISSVETTSLAGTDRNQRREPRTLSLTLAQPLFRGGRTLAATRGAENAVRAERARLQSVEQAVLLDAVTAYVDVFRDQAVVQLTVNNEQVLARQLEAAQDRFQVGEITRTDVFQAEARLAGATADRIEAEGNLVESRATYRNVVGMAPGVLVRPALPQGLPEGLQGAIDEAVRANPDVTAAEYDERSARDAVDEVQGELLPEVRLEGSASRSLDVGGEDVRSDSLSAIVSVSVPLYQSGAVYSRVREAKQTVVEARRALDQAQRDAAEAATQAWNALLTARAQTQSFTKAREANAVALEGVQREAAVGARTVLDILDAEQELLDSQVDLVGAQRDETVAAFQLQSAVGGLTAVRLGLPVDQYDPEVHYREVREKWFGGDSSDNYVEEDDAAGAR